MKSPYDDISKRRNREEGIEFVVEKDTSVVDFYTNYKPWETADSIDKTTKYLYEETYSEQEKKELFGDKNYYELHFSNKGGLVMPVIIEWEYEDGTKEIERIPVEIWRKDEGKVFKGLCQGQRGKRNCN